MNNIKKISFSLLLLLAGTVAIKSYQSKKTATKKTVQSPISITTNNEKAFIAWNNNYDNITYIGQGANTVQVPANTTSFTVGYANFDCTQQKKPNLCGTCTRQIGFESSCNNTSITSGGAYTCPINQSKSHCG